MNHEQRLELIHRPFFIITHECSGRWGGVQTGVGENYIITATGRRQTLGQVRGPIETGVPILRGTNRKQRA